jgi:glycosyltransferase involved in cell wall biosynthesis
MKVLMFGWEFPPFKSGGLGTACYDLTKGLSRQGIEVTFVMPKAPEDANTGFVKIIGTNNYMKNVKIRKVNSILTAYNTSKSYSETSDRYKILGTKGDNVYGKDLYQEVERFSEVAKIIAAEEPHDVIHAHDWMTYKAGINARNVSGKPLVCHIHATEFDRTGGNPNHQISQMEYEGLKAADVIIANSEYTKKNVVKNYGIDPCKIKVVHWGIDNDNPHYYENYEHKISDNDNIVLFLGRMTVQKGPDYFVETAKKVLDFVPNTKFVMAGTGDMLPRMIERSAELGISHNMLFTGFLEGRDVHRAFKMADLYVMPSVSEPFGIVALESIKNGTPMLISKQSGVSEVVTNALKSDFWDVDDMASKIVGTLKYKTMYNELKENSSRESLKFNLDDPARKTIDIYNQVLSSTLGWV